MPPHGSPFNASAAAQKVKKVRSKASTSELLGLTALEEPASGPAGEGSATDGAVCVGARPS